MGKAILRMLNINKDTEALVNKLLSKGNKNNTYCSKKPDRRVYPK